MVQKIVAGVGLLALVVGLALTAVISVIEEWVIVTIPAVSTCTTEGGAPLGTLGLFSATFNPDCIDTWTPEGDDMEKANATAATYGSLENVASDTTEFWPLFPSQTGFGNNLALNENDAPPEFTTCKEFWAEDGAGLEAVNKYIGESIVPEGFASVDAAFPPLYEELANQLGGTTALVDAAIPSLWRGQLQAALIGTGAGFKNNTEAAQAAFAGVFEQIASTSTVVLLLNQNDTDIVPTMFSSEIQCPSIFEEDEDEDVNGDIAAMTESESLSVADCVKVLWRGLKQGKNVIRAVAKVLAVGGLLKSGVFPGTPTFETAYPGVVTETEAQLNLATFGDGLALVSTYFADASALGFTNGAAVGLPNFTLYKPEFSQDSAPTDVLPALAGVSSDVNMTATNLGQLLQEIQFLEFVALGKPLLTAMDENSGSNDLAVLVQWISVNLPDSGFLETVELTQKAQAIPKLCLMGKFPTTFPTGEKCVGYFPKVQAELNERWTLCELAAQSETFKPIFATLPVEMPCSPAKLFKVLDIALKADPEALGNAVPPQVVPLVPLLIAELDKCVAAELPWNATAEVSCQKAIVVPSLYTANVTTVDVAALQADQQRIPEDFMTPYALCLGIKLENNAIECETFDDFIKLAAASSEDLAPFYAGFYAVCKEAGLMTRTTCIAGLKATPLPPVQVRVVNQFIDGNNSAQWEKECDDDVLDAAAISSAQVLIPAAMGLEGVAVLLALGALATEKKPLAIVAGLLAAVGGGLTFAALWGVLQAPVYQSVGDPCDKTPFEACYASGAANTLGLVAIAMPVVAALMLAGSACCGSKSDDEESGLTSKVENTY